MARGCGGLIGPRDLTGVDRLLHAGARGPASLVASGGGNRGSGFGPHRSPLGRPGLRRGFAGRCGFDFSVAAGLGADLRRIVVGVSGASGMAYTQDLLEALSGMAEIETHLVVTPGARQVLALELGQSPEALNHLAQVVHDDRNLAAPLASGSFATDGMVIVPASASTVAKVAYGFGENLLARAAYVHLKERRPLIVVLRETPLPANTLEALLKLSLAGAVIMPASPGFYHRPEQISDLVHFMTQRILEHLGLELPGARHWGET